MLRRLTLINELLCLTWIPLILRLPNRPNSNSVFEILTTKSNIPGVLLKAQHDVFLISRGVLLIIVDIYVLLIVHLILNVAVD